MDVPDGGGRDARNTKPHQSQRRHGRAREYARLQRANPARRHRGGHLDAIATAVDGARHRVQPSERRAVRIALPDPASGDRRPLAGLCRARRPSLPEQRQRRARRHADRDSRHPHRRRSSRCREMGARLRAPGRAGAARHPTRPSDVGAERWRVLPQHDGRRWADRLHRPLGLQLLLARLRTRGQRHQRP